MSARKKQAIVIAFLLREELWCCWADYRILKCGGSSVCRIF